MFKLLVAAMVGILAVAIAVPMLDVSTVNTLEDYLAEVRAAGYTVYAQGADNLQAIYENSSNPELTLTASVGGLTLRDTSGGLGASLFEVQNNAGSTTYLGIGSGNVTSSVKLIPETDNTTSLGDATHRWSELFVAGGSIHIGNCSISENASTSTIIVTSNQTFFNNAVGIGIANPASKLHLADTGSLQLILNADTDNSNESDAASILFKRDGDVSSFRIGVIGDDEDTFAGSVANTPYLESVSSAYGIQFATDGTLSMEITSGQDVIVKDVLTVENEIRLNTDGNEGDPGYTWESDADTGIFRGGTNILAFSTAGSEAMRIDASGNVGIGATTPGGDGSPNDFTAGGTLLEIGDGTKDCGITLRSRTSSGNAFDIWQDYSSINLYIDVRRDDDSSFIRFRTKTNATPVNALTIFGSGEIDAPGVYAETTASAANVFVAPDGSLRRSTSSRKLKESIDYDGVDPYVALQFKPVSFDAEADGSHHLGFVAEDMRDIDFRLATGGDLPGLEMNAIVAALTALAQDLEGRVTVLENQ